MYAIVPGNLVPGPQFYPPCSYCDLHNSVMYVLLVKVIFKRLLRMSSPRMISDSVLTFFAFLLSQVTFCKHHKVALTSCFRLACLPWRVFSCFLKIKQLEDAQWVEGPSQACRTALPCPTPACPHPAPGTGGWGSLQCPQRCLAAPACLCLVLFISNNTFIIGDIPQSKMWDHFFCRCRFLA